METIRYWLDFYTVPMMVALALWQSSPNGWMLYNAILAGYVVWVFFEYFMHRIIFHRWYRAEHWVHHRLPRKQQTSPSQLIVHLLLGSLFLACLGLLGARFGCAFFTGLAAGYWSYRAAHDAMHHDWITRSSPGPIGRMVARHELHHDRGFERNFNVVCPLGDIVFGTFVAAARQSHVD